MKSSITVDPVREEAKSRQEEVRTAAKNDGSGFREWIVEEAAWLVAQFTKVAMSVAVVRWRSSALSGRISRVNRLTNVPRISGLMATEQDESARWTLVRAVAGRRTAETVQLSAKQPHFDPSEDQNGAESPRYVVTVEGYHLYVHRKLLNPGRQFWPCPLLYVTACETCAFLEYDRGGRPQCVALVKLRTVLDGTNAGEDLSEIRQWIRSS